MNNEEKEEIKEMVILLYNKGYSISSIVDTVFRYSNSNLPINISFKNFVIDSDRRYTRMDCISYVAKVILNYNVSKNRK